MAQLPADSTQVLQLLRQKRAMPYLELTALSSVADERIRDIVRDFQTQNLVKVSNTDDPDHQIVSVRPAAFNVRLG